MIKITFENHIDELNVFWDKTSEIRLKEKVPNYNNRIEGYFITQFELEQIIREAYRDGSIYVEDYFKEIGRIKGATQTTI